MKIGYLRFGSSQLCLLGPPPILLTINREGIMQIHNLSWLADINKPIFTKKTDYQAVLKNTSGLPFITPPLHPELIEMLDKIGAEGRVEAGEKFPMALDSEDSFVLIKNGIAAREIQLLNSSLINLVLPSRSLCGDLNLFTNRGIKEQHFSITPCQYVLVSKKLLLSLLFKNPEILNAALSDIEQISLSHQLSLLIAGSLAVEERIKMFIFAWASNYSEEAEEGWLKMPFIVQRKYARSVARASRSSLDGILTKWKKNELIRTKGHHLFIASELIKSCASALS